MSAPADMRDKVTINQELFSVGVFFNQPAEEVRVWPDKVLSSHNGKIKRLSINKSLCVHPGQTMMVIEYCPHEMELNGLCAFCGADLTLIAKTCHKSTMPQSACLRPWPRSTCCVATSTANARSSN